MTDLLKNIAFQNSVEAWHAIVIVALLILAFMWEGRKHKPRFLPRIITLLIAFISLYIIYLSPFLLIEKPKQSVVIVGGKITENTVDSIAEEYKIPIIKKLSSTEFSIEGKQKVNSLSTLNFQIDTAYIYGYIPQLNPEHYQVRKDIMQHSGIQLDFPKSIVLGDSLIIEIKNQKAITLKVSAVVGQDSVQKIVSQKSTESLAAMPKANGYIFCQVYTEDERYQFAIFVEKAQPYVVQIIAEAPDFEWKFLSEYLQSKEHSVFQKTKISKDKFKSSVYNWYDTLSIERRVAKDLKVLFVDVLAWQNLSSGKQNRLKQTLIKNRGSLIFRTHKNSRISLNLDKPKPTKIFSTGNSLLQAEEYKYLQFNNIGGLDEVVKNSIFRRVSPDLVLGVINFQNSYQLSLAGKTEEYEAIWNPVWEHLVRKSNRGFIDQSKWAIQHQPYFFRLWSADAVKDVSIISPEKDTLELSSKFDSIYPERQHFMFYPKSNGWYFIKIGDETEPIPFYVHSEEHAHQFEFLADYNNDYLNYLNFDDSSTFQKKESYNQKSVTIWFFIVFVLCVAYLWIEDKIT